MIVFHVEHIMEHPMKGMEVFLKAEDMEGFFQRALLINPSYTYKVTTLMDKQGWRNEAIAMLERAESRRERFP